MVDWQDPVRKVVTRDWNSDENTILILTLLRPSLTCDEVAEMYGSEFQDTCGRATPEHIDRILKL